MFKVIFTGFETKEQAMAFAQWYSGSGEQQSGEWLEEQTDIRFAQADTIQDVQDGVEVELKLFKKD